MGNYYDLQELNQRAVITELYEQITGEKLRRHSINHYDGSCPRCGGTDRFYVRTEDNPQTFICTHCHPKKGTAIDFIALCYGLPDSGTGLLQTIERLAELVGVSPSDYAKTEKRISHSQQQPKPVYSMPSEPSNQWQKEVKQAVLDARDYLFRNRGYNPELQYLYNRGFSENTIRNYGIGFNPTLRNLDVTVDGEPVKALTGFYIPTCMRMYDSDPKPTTLMRVKVRTEEHHRISNQLPKYLFIKGSKAVSLFCAGYARPKQGKEYPNIIYVEGEFDAMTINQCAGDICRAVTFGSNSYIGRAEQWQMWYRIPENTVICFDNDDNPDTRQTVRNNEQRLRTEIIKAQSLDNAEIRANAPVIRHLPEQYHDWNDVLQLHGGEQIIRNILKDMFEVK